MERLQEAIKKAREQRETVLGAEPSDGAKADDRPLAQDTDAVTAAWMALPVIDLPPAAKLREKRLMTIEASEDAAPFDLLRTRLLQQAKQNSWRRIGFVSPHGSCGKTTSVANLAFSLARQTDKRTIAFDFDLRRHGLTSMLAQSPKTSLTDVLEERAPFSDNGTRYGTNLAFGLNRNSTTRASEILQNTAANQVLKMIEEQYAPNIMLFDLPPLMASDENFGFLDQLDAAVIMAAADKTTMSQIDVAERQVAELTNVMGIVLNKCRYMHGAYGHEYNYY